jgi:hypothetical protein
MFRNRIAIVALGLLLVAFQSTSPAAVSQEPQKGDAPVPADAALMPFPQFAPGETSDFAVANQGPRAAERVPGQLLELQRGVALPVSAGTGGGDISESEPNSTYDSADVALDLPFQCRGVISTDGDLDWIRVDVTQGVPIEVDVFAEFGYLESPLDPGLIVKTDSLQDIGRNDDIWPGNLNSRLLFVAPYTGSIYIIVKGVGDSGGAYSNYIVAAWPAVTPVFDSLEAEPNDIPGQAEALVLPGVKYGTITEPGDVDMTWFEAEAGSQLVVDVHSRSYDLPLDSVVELLDESGRTLFLNDDADSDRDSRFNLVLPETGHYLLRVRDNGNGGGPWHRYILGVSLQDRSNSPMMTKLKFASGHKLKKITGYNFVPGETGVEVLGYRVQSAASAVSPTTVIKVKPTIKIEPGQWVTVVNPNGRRSNPYVRLPS